MRSLIAVAVLLAAVPASAGTPERLAAAIGSGVQFLDRCQGRIDIQVSGNDVAFSCAPSIVVHTAYGALAGQGFELRLPRHGACAEDPCEGDEFIVDTTTGRAVGSADVHAAVVSACVQDHGDIRINVCNPAPSGGPVQMPE